LNKDPQSLSDFADLKKLLSRSYIKQITISPTGYDIIPGRENMMKSYQILDIQKIIVYIKEGVIKPGIISILK